MEISLSNGESRRQPSQCCIHHCWPGKLVQKHSSSSSLVAQMVRNPPALRRPGFNPWVGKIPWRRKWQHTPTPVFLPGEFHGQTSLAGYSPWSHKESDTTEYSTPSLKEAQICLLLWEKLQFPFSNYNDILVWARSKQSNHIHIPEGFSLIFSFSSYLQQR